MGTNKNGKSEQIAIRLPHDVIGRVDAHAERLRSEHAGFVVNRAVACRELLLSALDAAERKTRAKARPKPGGRPSV